MTPDEGMKIVDQALQLLGEHFDQVQILVSWPEDVTGNTHTIMKGEGNVFARIGMCREYLIKADERTRLETRRDEKDEA